MHQKINPFICSEVLALVNELLQVDVGDLDRLQCLNLPSHLDVLTTDVANGHNTPHTVTTQQFRVTAHVIGTDRNTCQAEVGKSSLILVILFVEHHGHLVDNAVLAVLAYQPLDRLCLGTVNIVVLDDLFHLFQALADDILIIAGAILSQEVFQHIGRNRKTSLYEESQILSYHLAYEGIHYFLLQIHMRYSLKVLFYHCIVLHRLSDKWVQLVIHIVDSKL